MSALPLGGRPQTRYAETNLGYLGYQVIGDGDRDIMFLTGALSNSDAIWDEPSAVRFFDRLGTMGRIIRYDMRGSGISDPVPSGKMWMTIEENVDDVRAVLEAAGSKQAVVYGDTEGGLSAMMLAATDPERVSALVLVNAVPYLLRDADYPIGAPPEAADALSKQYVAQHGTTSDMLELTAPSVANDMRFRTWWTRYQRMSVPLGLVKTTFDWFAEVDVRAALPLITVPTLVVARRDAKLPPACLRRVHRRTHPGCRAASGGGCRHSSFPCRRFRADSRSGGGVPHRSQEVVAGRSGPGDGSLHRHRGLDRSGVVAGRCAVARPSGRAQPDRAITA